MAAANRVDFRNHLTTCLMLVAPVGMTERQREEWLTVAWGTLSHLPPDLLAIGAAAARQTADHPSKIVPIIIGETTKALADRKAERAKVAKLLAKRAPFPWEHDDGRVADRCTKEDAAAIMAEFGLRSESREEARRHQGPPQNPTRQDYIDMGVDPAVLDKLEADRAATTGHVSTRAA